MKTYTRIEKHFKTPYLQEVPLTSIKVFNLVTQQEGLDRDTTNPHLEKLTTYTVIAVMNDDNAIPIAVPSTDPGDMAKLRDSLLETFIIGRPASQDETSVTNRNKGIY